MRWINLGVIFLVGALVFIGVWALASVSGAFRGESNLESPISSMLLGKESGGCESDKKILSETFEKEMELIEVGEIERSASCDWWLNSGGVFLIKEGVGHTNKNNLSEGDIWRVRYEAVNPIDTQEGYRPQNIFRLLTRGRWLNVRQQVYFKILADNLTESPNRNESNGILLISRYLDDSNLYYAGLRVDGEAVIKKKQGGRYITLAEKKIYAGSYDKSLRANLLPHDRWLGIKTETRGSEGGVLIVLYLDRERGGKWEEVLRVMDKEVTGEIKPITFAGHGGMRSDFMDLEFDDYRIEEVED